MLLFVTRAFLSTTYGVSQYRLNVVLSMLSALVAIALQLVLIIPPLVLTSESDKDFLRVAFERSKSCMIVLSFTFIFLLFKKSVS